MGAVNVDAFETMTRHGDVVRADVYLPKQGSGPFPVLLGASPYQKALRHLPGSPVFPLIEYDQIQLYLDGGYAYVAMDVQGKPPSVEVSQGWLSTSRRAEDPALSTDMRPFLRHDRDEPITPGTVYELRIELMPMSVLIRAGERLRLEISNWESAQTEAPITHRYGQKAGTDTYHHDAAHPSRLRLHERPRNRATRDSEREQSS